MTTMTTSEQHAKLGTSRSNHDKKDSRNIQEWFDHHEWFDLNNDKLYSLSYYLTASVHDGVNYHETEKVGSCIQKQLDNIPIPEASIKRSHQVCSLNHLTPGIQVETL